MTHVKFKDDEFQTETCHLRNDPELKNYLGTKR